ncbi:MAG: recombination mediator RecR [Verrucomicrobia bacterium]|nr:recombination mediator RecR [Verrucomicrobiota bacterium]MBU1910019.1 recombination mediator RecR [Verrucomicrobiota bacterium]
MPANEPMARLQAALGKLPGVGKRSAERMTMALVREGTGLLRSLIVALQDVEAQVRLCSLCGGLTLKDQDPCALCRDPRREAQLLCVVEGPSDILLIERAGAFRGRYHALLGRISPMQGEGIPDRRVEALVRRIEKEGVREVILALDTDVESDATASYLAEVLGRQSVKVTRLALGIPAGSAIAYSDPVTLARALQGRAPLRHGET